MICETLYGTTSEYSVLSELKLGVRLALLLFPSISISVALIPESLVLGLAVVLSSPEGEAGFLHDEGIFLYTGILNTNDELRSPAFL